MARFVVTLLALLLCLPSWAAEVAISPLKRFTANHWRHSVVAPRVEFSTDGSRAISHSFYSSRVWDRERGTLLAEASRITDLSPDGHLLLQVSKKFR